MYYDKPSRRERDLEGEHSFEWDACIDEDDSEIPVVITFDFIPGEETVMYPNDSAYPGSPPEIEDFDIVREDNGEDVTERVVAIYGEDTVIQWCFDQLF